ncbi:MAG: hypothetical protein J0J11_06205, partial [Microbacterium sp.]|nr:hypothetical protein [Microbacterium sp.]
MSSSYSAHRPGRFGSDGRIELDGSEEDEPLYLSDVRDAERDRDGDELPEDPFEDEFLDVDPNARTEPVPPVAAEDASAAA